MRLKNFCPVSSLMMDEHKSRVSAALTLALLLTYFYIPTPGLIVALGVDFALRGFGKSTYSPIALVAGWLIKSLHLKSNKINAGPKIFAARIGMVFCCLIVLLSLLNLHIAALITALTLTLFAFLETAIGFCMACYIYPYVLKFTEK